MRAITLLFIFLTIFTKANNQKTPSTINEVTVYLNGAQVVRTAQVTLEKGTSAFVFNNLSPNIEESSIQISGLDNTSILSINYGINYLDKNTNTTEIENFKAKIISLNDKIQLEGNFILGYEEELNLIQSNRKLGNATENVNLEKLKAFAIYYRERLTIVNNEIFTSRKKISGHNKEINALKKQLKEYNVTDKIEKGEIKIKLSSELVSTLNLTLKYNVIDAGWFPIYDLKAKKINTPLNLIYKAHIYQNTGIDWHDVKVTLSTSNPNTNNVKPELNPKYLNIINRYSNYKNNRATKKSSYAYNPFVQSVSGIIVGANGLPLRGVNVKVNGTSNGAQTDFDGKYRLNVESGNELTFSYVGMNSETIPIHSSIMNINMEEDLSVLDEVVVTAMGLQRDKKALGYGVGSIKAEEYTNRSEKDIARILSGKASGVQITSNSGASENSSHIKIRGYSSISGMNQALFVVDGVPYNQSSEKILSLDSKNIERVNVLKGQSARALYGNRASNGVIVITTKKNNYTSTGDIIAEGITNTKFEIKKQYSIPTSGDVTVIKINEFSVPAKFSYFAAPIVNENVFLTAKFGGWEQYKLLPGEANIYFEGSYSGKTNINPNTIADSLTISLGVDPNVIVKRSLLNDFKNKSFIGNAKIINRAYEIELRNSKQSSIDIILVDRIPISQNKEIKIDDVKTGIATYDSEKGLLKWKIKLAISSTKTHKFSYAVKYPKQKRINL